jgi:hypothetical protein
LELINSDFGSSEVTKQVLDEWEEKREVKTNNVHSILVDSTKADIEHQHQLPLQPVNQTNVEDEITYASTSSDLTLKQDQPLFTETQILLRRHFIMTFRDPVLYLGRCIMALVLNCIFAVVYWETRNYTQDQAMAKGWLVVWYSSVPIMFGTVAVYSLNDELSTIQKEQKNGIISRPASYILAKFAITLPFILIYALFSLGIPGWVLQKYPSSSWFKALILWATHTYIFESLAECLAIWVKDKVLGMLVYLAYWISAFLFSGLFLPFDNLLAPMKALYYATPFSYYIRSMYYLLYNNVTFDSCNSALNPFEPICEESGAGSDVIDGLNKILPLFENKDTFTKDIGVMLIMIAIFKIFYITGIVVKGQSVSIPVQKKKV